MPEHLTFVSIFIALFFGFIIVVCLLNIINPRLLWNTFQSWKAKKEPSDTYFIVIRITNLIALLLVIFFLLGPAIARWL
ncbi:hypothetical protein RI065_08520 [Mycoplasmatota bacterium zrk1]